MPIDGAGATSDRRSAADDLPELREQLLELVRTKGYTRSDEPIQLASGEWSRDFVDGKAALSDGPDLLLACRAILALAAAADVDFDAVGGLTMGADHFAHGVALVGQRRWFVVRKEPKGRGTNKLIEGSSLGEHDRVLLVDDVVTTGGSIEWAYHRVREHGAQVALVTTLVDRGETAPRFFRAEGITYQPLLTYRDLGIEPVGG